MTAVQSEKQKALILRKSGKSYNQIAEELSLSKSTISEWLKNEAWSNKIKTSLSKKVIQISRERILKLNAGRRDKLLQSYACARIEAQDEFRKLRRNPLFLIGVSIYWGEGYKGEKNGAIKVGNTDPKMLLVFVDFLQKICKVPKSRIKAWMLLYPDNSIEESLNFWSKQINIEKQNFYKSTVIEGRHKSRRLPHGVCTVGITNKYIKTKLLEWIKFLPSAGVVQW